MCADDGGRQPAPGPAGAVCVFCRRHPAAQPWRPFCSERCKLQDLARWADGSYRVAGLPSIDADDAGIPIGREDADHDGGGSDAG